MEGKRLIAVPEALWDLIEKNRGELSAADFIDLAIESQLNQEVIRDEELAEEIARAEARKGEIEQIREKVEALLQGEETRGAVLEKAKDEARKLRAGMLFVSRQELEAVKARVIELEIRARRGFWLGRLFRRRAR